MAPETRSQTFFRYLDSVISPEARQKALTFVVNFTKERPYVATYIYLFLLFSLLPIIGLVVFVLFLVSVLLFWVAVALCAISLILLFTGTAAMMVWVWAVCLVLSGRWFLNLVSPSVVAKAESIGLVDNSSDDSNGAKKQVEASPGTKKENKDTKGGTGTLTDRTNERTVGDDYLDFDDSEENSDAKKSRQR